MNTFYFFKKIMFFLILFTVGSAYAQDTLTVDSNNGEFGLLNEVIVADTLDNGERANAVYRLLRGQTYILSGPLENREYTLNIVAEEGDGARPRLVPGVPDGGSSGRPFRARDNLTLKGLYITGKDQSGGLNPDQRIIRISATDARVEVDDCWLDQDGQSAFRTDNSGIKLFITNSIISNIGQPSNTNNGRGIDDRGNDLDTVLIENCTWYNISSNICNDRGGWIKYAKINQNTFVRTGQRIFDFDETQTAIFTNNLVINAGYLGIEDDTVAVDEWLMELDTLTPETVTELPDIAQTLTFTNNNIYLDSALIQAFPADTSQYPGADWPIVPKPVYNAAFEAFAGEAQLATNIVEAVDFENDPGVDDLLTIVEAFYLDPRGNDDKESVPNWDISGEPFDFSYQDTYISAISSSSGGQLGALTWEINLTGIGGLRELVDDAQVLVENATVGGNIGSHAQESIDALSSAIATATVVRDDPGSTAEEIEAARVALQDAVDLFNESIVTGFGDQVKTMARIYPNPTSDYVRFTDDQSESYEIFSISGHLVASDSIVPNQRLSLTNLKSGNYIMRIKLSNNEVSSFRFVKK